MPLGLELIGGFLSAPERSLFPELAKSALDEIADSKHRLSLALKRFGASQDRQLTLEETVLLSLENLPAPAVGAFPRLGAFTPKPATFDLDAAKAVTGVDAKYLAMLVARGLVTKTGGDRMTLHQVVAEVANAQAVDLAPVRLAHAAHYARVVSGALRDYALNDESKSSGPATRTYRSERDQIDAAIEWLMNQDASRDADDALMQFANGMNFMPLAAVYDASYQQRVRTAAIAAATRAGRPDARARWQLVESTHLEVAATTARMSGRLEDAARLMASALELVRAAGDTPQNWPSVLPGEFGASFSALYGPEHRFGLLVELLRLQRQRGELRPAVGLGEEALSIAQASGNKECELTALSELGGTLADLGQDERALEYLQQYLPLARDLSPDEAKLAETLGNLGVLSYRLERTDQATAYLKEALDLGQKTNSCEIVRASASLLATILDKAKRPSEAGQYLLYQLQIVRLQLEHETTTGKSKAETLARFFGQSQIDSWRSQIVALAKEEADILTKLGHGALDAGDSTTAVNLFAQALAIARQLPDVIGEAVTLGNLGIAHTAAGNVAKAIESYEASLAPMKESRNRRGLFLALANLAHLYLGQGLPLKALEPLQLALQAAIEIDVPHQIMALDRLGQAHMVLAIATADPARMAEAIGYLEQGLHLAQQTGDEEQRSAFTTNLTRLRAQRSLMG